MLWGRKENTPSKEFESEAKKALYVKTRIDFNIFNV